eukprot:7142733-Lingulodinium_polyedra.AAC.1
MASGPALRPPSAGGWAPSDDLFAEIIAQLHDRPAGATEVSSDLAPRFCGPPSLYAEQDGQLMCRVCNGCAPPEHLVSAKHRKKLEQLASFSATKGVEWPPCYRNSGP